MATESLSELLRRYRARAGLTQAALAAKAGLSEQAISVLERGTRSRPRHDTVRALTSVLGLNADEAAGFAAVARGNRRNRPVPPAPDTEAPATDSLPMPWQLPPAVPDFTGRAAQIEAILSALRVPAAPVNTTVGLVAVTGMGGIGKTTLAIQAAHKLVGSYPDGHLYLNLRGYGPGVPVTIADALRQLLRSLGLDLQLIPEGVEEAAALLRSQLAGRRVLVVLDNATDVPHVLPLLPGSPGSAVIITSRGSMAALPGARQVRLDALSDTESVELLSGVVGADRVVAEAEAADSLTLLTGRLPLAVRLIGARLAARPTWPIQHLVDLLQDEGRRLDGLGSDETGVRASIASSVQFLETSDRGLDRDAARALPMLSVPDGSDLLTVVAAHLLDIGVQRADAILERLVDLNLLDSVAPERYRFHDLIRAYGRELAEQSFTAAERDDALERVLRFYTARLGMPADDPRGRPRGCHWPRSRIEPFAALADKTARCAGSTRGRQPVGPLPSGSGRRWRGPRCSPSSPSRCSAITSPGEAGRDGRIPARNRPTRSAAEPPGDGRLARARQRHPGGRERATGAVSGSIWTALDMFPRNDIPGQARCASSLAYVLGLLGQLDEASVGGRFAPAEPDPGPDHRGRCPLPAVGLYDRAGEYERADQAFDRGIGIAEQARDTRGLFKKNFNAGFRTFQVGRYRDAVRRCSGPRNRGRGPRRTSPVGKPPATPAVVYAAQGEFDTARHHPRPA